jgi:hypothetical protein
MIILENQDERSPLKIEGEIDVTTRSAAPPYLPTLPPISTAPSYQAVPHSQHVTLPRRQLPIRRLLVASIACLILLLCGAFLYGFYKTAISSIRR